MYKSNIKGLARNGVIFLLFTVFATAACFGQRKFSDGEIDFSIRVVNKGSLSPKAVNMLEGGKLVYNFKNHLFRSDMRIGKTEYVNVYNSRDHSGLSLIKAGADKNYLVRMRPEDLKEEAAKFDNMTFNPQNENKEIAGFTCRKTIGKMANGDEFAVYYTTELQPPFADYNPRFKGLNGLPLQFEVNIAKSNAKLMMTAIKVKPGFQSSTLFEAPKSGFRELTYQELRALRNRD